MSRHARPAILAVVGAALALAIAGCGGDGGNNSSGNTTKGSINEDPATQVLHATGLEVCSQSQLPSTLVVDPDLGFAGARKFVTAPDCSKKGPRTTIVAATFSSHEGIAAGKKAIKKKYPQAAVTSYKTVVIGVLGPNAQKVANTIEKELSSGATSQ
jgi:hypothetical protein